MATSFRSVGQGRPVVFVHGWMTSGRVWDRVLSHLGEVRAIVPDLRIASASPEGASSVSLDELAKDVLAVADEAGVATFDLVGHSMGGAVAQLAAAAAPSRVRSLALLCPVPATGLPLPPDVAGFFRGSGGSRDAQGGILDKACLALAPEDRAALLDHAGRIAPEWIASAFDVWTRGVAAPPLAAITAPTLVLATDDPFLPPAFLDEQVARRIARGKLEILRGPGHYPQVERAEDTAAALRRFWGET